MAVTVILIPKIIHQIPYFKRGDVIARRAAKIGLPRWVSNMEMLFLSVFVVALIYPFYSAEAMIHHMIHPNLPFLSLLPPRVSFTLVLWLIQLFAPLTTALPLAMVMANLLSWLIIPIRRAENRIMAEGVPGYTWRNLNLGLLKAAALMVPMSVILASISLMRF